MSAFWDAGRTPRLFAAKSFQSASRVVFPFQMRCSMHSYYALGKRRAPHSDYVAAMENPVLHVVT